MKLNTVDGFNFVRDNPGRFFRAGVPNPIEIIQALLGEILLLGASSTVCRHEKNWWLIAADVDWLEDESRSVQEFFEKIIPFPEGGDNSMRAEILAGVFATDVLTLGESGEISIKGNFERDEPVWELARKMKGTRVVAFRFLSS